jgi:hypothetical protein
MTYTVLAVKAECDISYLHCCGYHGGKILYNVLDYDAMCPHMSHICPEDGASKFLQNIGNCKTM